MAKSKKEPKSINLLEPVFSPGDAISSVYLWLTNIGKYLLIAVEILVLAVFFSRFILDKKNNDLTEDINQQITLLNNETWKKNSTLYSNYQTLLTDISLVRKGQRINSSVISEIISGIPVTLKLQNFSYNENRVSLDLMAVNFEEIKIYETSLKSNTGYSDVKFNIIKDRSDVSVRISFNLNNAGQ